MSTSVDRYQLNTEISSLLAGFGWRPGTENDADDLDQLTHLLADWIEGRDPEYVLQEVLEKFRSNSSGIPEQKKESA